MTDNRNHPPFIASGEEARPGGGCTGAIDAVTATLKRNGWDSDPRLLRQCNFDLLIHGIARDIAEAMAIGMNHDVDKIGIVEGCGSLVVGGVIKFPVRRPQF